MERSVTTVVSLICMIEKVVASLNSHRIDAQLAIDTLNIAVKNNSIPDGLILHSDQGSQFCSKTFSKHCESFKIQQSMSRAGCPGDNAVMERFYGTFKLELINVFHFTQKRNLMWQSMIIFTIGITTVDLIHIIMDYRHFMLVMLHRLLTYH